MEGDMFEFIFCTATPLSDRYKKSIVRRLQAKKSFPFSTGGRDEKLYVLVGDWTLYHGDENIFFVLSRDTVKAILGAKRLKEW